MNFFVFTKIDIKVELQATIDKFVKMVNSNTISCVSDDIMIKKSYTLLNDNYKVHAKTLTAKYPLCCFDKLNNEYQLGMQATKDALALYFTNNQEPGFMALYMVICYALGAEIENISSLTAPIVINIIMILMQLQVYSEKIGKLLKRVQEYLAANFKISFTIALMSTSLTGISDDINF